MLTDLQIKNYALIEQLNLRPHESLNIITGETGAGKSIMLGAIGLLMGNRADLRVLLNTEEKCVIEASFLVWSYNLQGLFDTLDLDYADRTTLRREISPSGKSRAFINDTPVTLDTLRQVAAFLLDIHSQHDNLLLGDHLYQMQLVDAYAANQALREAYQQTYRTYTHLKNEYRQRQQDFAHYQKEFDYNQFLLNELSQANLQADEQESLEQESRLLDSAEEVKLKLQEVLAFLSHAEGAVNDEMRGKVNALGQIADLSPAYASLRGRLESCLFELRDIANELEREEEKIEFNPERAEEVQNRLSMIYHFQQKHQAKDIAALLDIQAELAEKVSRVANFDEEIAALKAQLETTERVLLEQGEALSASRQAVAPLIAAEAKSLLADLGMPNATIEITCDRIEPSPEGLDVVNFLFSANKGIAPQEIGRVASGGEFSRLMLALKYIMAGRTAMPTIIFDEIDTGISGEIALKMGNMLKAMTHKHQVIAITHLHQIAAKGNHHYFVFKDDSGQRTISRMRQLNEEERIREIAQMISGAQPSESALLSARELLEMG
ncbi:MAG: DNA repair protein RecN [Microscillaceae bacterium]|nr:DNA repair protein RecN [Microscillaceae bacterium]